jgi:ribonuclease HI
VIRLYTDAGIKDGVATWATVAIVEGQLPIELSGRLRDDLRCSATAECRAIANALHQLVRAGHAPAGTTVRVYSDSRHAVDRINMTYTRKQHSSAAKAVAVVHRIKDDRRIGVDAQWIPGHKPDDHSEHARWNNRCDALCRAARTLPRPSPARKALTIAKRLAGVRA